MNVLRRLEIAPKELFHDVNKYGRICIIHDIINARESTRTDIFRGVSIETIDRIARYNSGIYKAVNIIPLIIYVTSEEGGGEGGGVNSKMNNEIMNN